MHTLCALGVSVLIGTSELGNPTGKKWTGAKVVSSINGYDNDYCLIMPSSAKNVSFETMVDEPTENGLHAAQRAMGTLCSCSHVVSNKAKPIVPALAAPMKKENDKFIHNIGK